MSITKEQFKRFKQNFEIIEETNAIFTHVANFNF